MNLDTGKLDLKPITQIEVKIKVLSILEEFI